MEKIQYDQQEAKLVYQAQEMMVSLEQSAYNLENLQSTRDLLQQQYEATQAQMSVGMATQTDVLTALKSVQDQDTAILTAKKSQENVHRNLCLMLGWSADAQPEIREVPQPDLSRVDALDPNADAQTAIDNNYDVRYYTKKAGNLTSQDLIESNQAAIVNAKDTAIRSLKTQYNTVLTTRDSLNAAKAGSRSKFKPCPGKPCSRKPDQTAVPEYIKHLYISQKRCKHQRITASPRIRGL